MVDVHDGDFHWGEKGHRPVGRGRMVLVVYARGVVPDSYPDEADQGVREGDDGFIW